MYTKSGLCRSAGSGPTISMPGTSISSLVGYMPISASPRWTTSPTRGELLAGGWRNEADLRPGRAGGRLAAGRYSAPSLFASIERDG
jgi:hypothetical protein